MILDCAIKSKSAFTWSEAKQVADLVVFENLGEHLKDIEMDVILGSWSGLTYEKMAERYHLFVNYLRGDVG